MALYLTSCEIVQQVEHSTIKSKQELEAFVYLVTNKYKTIKQCVAVLHDRDIEEKTQEPKAIHFHIYCKFGTSQDIEWISKVFQVEPQFINKIKGSWRDALAYATHKNAPNKYQYLNDDLILYNMTMEDYDKEVSKVDLDKKRIEQALFDYGDLKISKNTLLSDFLNSAEVYSRYEKLFKKMTDYRILKVGKREMKVIYICGPSGSGKTTLAKFLAEENFYDYFVSGSGADFLDGYDKEECIILDDFRSDMLTPSELFKLCDNHTNSSVKARYKNKDISNCKLLIITSITAPQLLYQWEQMQEPFKQFARRLNYTYLTILNDGIIDGSILDKMEPLRAPVQHKQCPYTMQHVFKALRIIEDSTSLLEDIFKINPTN